MKKAIHRILAASLLFVALVAPALADVPPTNAMPLSSIIGSLETGGYGAIKSIEFDDGFQEVEVRKNGTKRKLNIDPNTGKPRS